MLAGWNVLKKAGRVLACKRQTAVETARPLELASYGVILWTCAMPLGQQALGEGREGAFSI